MSSRRNAFSGVIEAARAQGDLVRQGVESLPVARLPEPVPAPEAEPTAAKAPAGDLTSTLRELHDRARTATVEAYGVTVPVPPSDQDVTVQVSARIPKAMRLAIQVRCQQLNLSFGDWVTLCFEAMLNECRQVLDPPGS